MTEKKRQSNFELLRIIAMLMIIGSHLACHGIQHVTSTVDSYQIYLSGTDLNKAVISFLNMGGGSRCRYIFYDYWIFSNQ